MKNRKFIIFVFGLLLLSAAGLRVAAAKISPAETTSASTIPTVNKNREENIAEYGPCIDVPVLMYHHIQDMKVARKKGQTGLSVSPEYFRKHLEYLSNKGFTTISPDEFIAMLDSGKKFMAKPVLITIDDGYEDNYSQMYPLLQEFGAKVVIFTPTGLVNKKDYLNWRQIEEMRNSGLVFFGNHTWSHMGNIGAEDKRKEEIKMADWQLADKGLNGEKFFAYPYGKPGTNDNNILKDIGYRIAFTTNKGSLMCLGKSLELPRIRVGNKELEYYGL